MQRRGYTLRTALSVFLVLSLFTGSALGAAADSVWNAEIPDYDIFPPRLIAVDKNNQKLHVFEKQSPLKLLRTFTCTTGQAKGDKLLEGDLKTPEGIYFIERRIASGLDFIKYGKEAYTLNYPNPVDKLRQKSGYGIWIHGRGEAIVPLQTEGCVAMNNGDIALVGKLLVPGMPVALASSVAKKEDLAAQAKKAVILEKTVRSWLEAWANRSENMFDYYDGESYSLSTESFSAFKTQKARLFKSLNWIKTSIRDLQALQGPGYWVTWFYQEYEAPNLATSGMRRLYWTENESGEFKIIAMEWSPQAQPVLLASVDTSHLKVRGLPAATDAGGSRAAVATTLTAQAKLEAKKEVELLPVPSFPKAKPQEISISGLWPKRDTSTMRELLVAEADVVEAYPAPDIITDQFLNLTIDTREKGAATASAVVKSAGDEQAGSGVGSGARAGAETADVETATTGTETAGATGAETGGQTSGGQAGVAAAGETTATASAKGDATAADSGDADGRGTSQAATEGTAGQTADASGNDGAKTEAAMDELLEQEALKFVENWRLAWLSGDVDKYMGFYDAKAVQGTRKNAAAIKAHKQKIWSGDSRPGKVDLSGLKVTVAKDSVTVDMRQVYSDKGGKGDTGMKRLLLSRKGSILLIAREDWKPL